MLYTFEEIINEINTKSKDYNIGDLQKIRSTLRNGMKVSDYKIFSGKSTKIIDKWAAHHGGSQELQFNIAFEDEGLRYGVALSLKQTQSLLDVSILFPHLRALNDLIVNESFDFSSYVLFRWTSEGRSDFKTVGKIPESWATEGNFIFLGKVVPFDEIDIEDILSTFDDLLPTYIEVQQAANGFPEVTIERQKKASSAFKFKNGRKPQSNHSRTTRAKQIDVTVRHNLIQEIYAQNWKSLLGDNKVTVENPIGYKSIDIVIDKGDHYEFTEVKTAGTAKECIRQALGQLLEYGFYMDNIDKPVKLVVVGEKRITKGTSNYLDTLNNTLDIPISYRNVSL